MRVSISGVFLVSIIFTSFSDLARLPVTLLRPTGFMHVFSWSFYDRLFTPTGMLALKCALVISLVMSTAGYLSSTSTKVAALLVLFYQGLLRSLGHFNHDEIIAVYFLIVLAFTPCGEAFAVDAWPGGKQRKPGFAYGYPILLMQILLAWSYFSSALIKLRISGLSYFGPDNLPALAITQSLDNLHDAHFRLAFWLPAIRQYTPVIVVIVLVWELLFPLAIFSRRLRWWILGFGVVFHVATLLLMNFFFAYHLAMYVVFIDWPRVLRWLSKRFPFRRAALWWRRFRLPPEHYPGMLVTSLGKDGVLLWDGECSFCALMVEWLRRIGRTSFCDQSFQSVAGNLPQKLRRWSTCQAHWIDPSGEVIGGSAAVIKVLNHSGRGMLASLLGTGVCRPFLWLGYRLVARNRSSFRIRQQRTLPR